MYDIQTEITEVKDIFERTKLLIIRELETEQKTQKKDSTIIQNILTSLKTIYNRFEALNNHIIKEKKQYIKKYTKEIINDVNLLLIGILKTLIKLINLVNDISEDPEIKICDFINLSEGEIDEISSDITQLLEMISDNKINEEDNIITSINNKKYKLFFSTCQTTIPQKNNTYLNECKQGIVQDNVNHLKNYLINSLCHEIDLDKWKNGDFYINSKSKIIKVYPAAKLNGVRGPFLTRLIFYIKKNGKKITIHICDYINRAEHNEATSNPQNTNYKYVKISKGINNMDTYKKLKWISGIHLE